jgi:ribosomal protein S3
MSQQNISKKRKFVADGIFYAELNEFLGRELGEDGYSGVEVRVTPMRTEVIIRATRTQNVLGTFAQPYIALHLCSCFNTSMSLVWFAGG